MINFVDDIIERIDTAFKADSEIKAKVTVVKAYRAEHTINAPEICVQAVDDSAAERYDTYDGEEVSYVPIQITCYTEQMTIAGIKRTAQDSALIFAEKIKQLFDMAETVKWNSNIVRMRRVGGIFGMPLQEGTTTYTSPIRYDFYVNKNYKKIKGE